MSNDQGDWMQFYQLQGHFLPHLGSSTAAEATVVSVSTAAASSSPPSSAVHGSSSGTTSLSPEGGVAKPARRRSRASRRTPTTVMNTDTANFRAMVQQFTGGPPPGSPFASGAGPSMLSFGFGHGQGQGRADVGPGGLMAVPSAAGFHHVQYSPHQYQQQYDLLSLNRNTSTNSHNNPSGDDRHFSLGRIGSGSSRGSAMEALRARPPGSSCSDENRGNDYTF